jgi:hypothetical protein
MNADLVPTAVKRVSGFTESDAAMSGYGALLARAGNKEMIREIDRRNELIADRAGSGNLDSGISGVSA